MSIRSEKERNVWFHDAAHPNVELGGFFQNGSITEANFLDILEILLVVEGEPGPLRVQERISKHINRSSIEISDEFGKAVRERDGGKCMISGFEVPQYFNDRGEWPGMDACHVFPLSLENIWNEKGCRDWVRGEDDGVGSSRINSVRNGLLLHVAIHRLFDLHLVSVNPDDGYKIVVFCPDMVNCDGRVLDPACRIPGDPTQVSNKSSRRLEERGRVFGHDCPPEIEMSNEIIAGPYGRERFELEMGVRLSKGNRLDHGYLTLAERSLVFFFFFEGLTELRRRL
ncbi:hypothetical protein B9Z19DRAFT_1119987 [Tuber borchii]|uniref:Uncharacterized protein n=1 Tax=Tuber borchii TaxID=42251 RepID=A0A2T7A560_TUBBO|nr:hypothetical protein B9Z19DRAFT_1119987 [Tuber borchii]